MRNLFSLSLVVSVFFFAAVPVFALTLSPTGTQSQTAKTTEAKPVESQSMRVQKELERRIAGLQKVLNHINRMNKISDTQKTSLTESINAQIATLTALLEKIKTGSSPAELKSDIASITKDYRIFALYLQKVNIMNMSDRVINTTDTFTQMLATLQVRISEARERGEDVVEQEKLLADAQKRISSATANAQNALSLVTSLTPEGYPANKRALINARTMLMKAHQDLISARINIREIRQLLKTGKKSASSVSGAVSPAPSKP